jgi:predicted transposase/invertase (TIGR01784 family)
VLKNLPKLQARPTKLQEKLFSEAEIAKLTQEEMRTYEGSLKTYRDIYSVLETAKIETKIEIAREMKKEGDSVEKIARITGLSKEQVQKL